MVNNMKIVLALPPHSFEDRYGKSIAKAAGTLPPLGLLCLAAYLKREGHKVWVVDGSIDSFSYLMNLIKKEKPDVLGITAMTFLWKKAVKILELVKTDFPSIFTVVGGAHPTFYPKQCFSDSPHLDAVVISEGELTFSELCNNLEKGKSLDNVSGLAIRKKDGKIKINKPRPAIKDLDGLPMPARELVDISRYKPALEQYKRLPVTNMMGSRGCPFQCLFCSHVCGDSIRYRSPKKIIEEIKILVNDYGIKDIAFWDDTMTVDKKRVLEICRLIKEEGLDITWSAQARVNTVNPEVLKAMKKAGCWKIFYGVESLLQKNLNALKKGTKVENAFDAVKWTKKAGIAAETSFIFGIPGETYEDAKETVKKIIKLNPDYMKCFPLTPIPGTELYENVDKYGKMLTDDLDKFTENKIVFVPYTMTEEQLKKIIPYAYKRFYLRPSYIIKQALKIRSISDIQKAIRGAMAVVGL